MEPESQLVGVGAAEGAKGVQLTVPARAENVAVVRHALAGLAAALEMNGDAIADLKTIVTEACMNVVMHAYAEEGGPLEIRAWPEDEQFAVSVRDYGVGIRPRAEPERISLRLGLALIAALSETFAINSKPGRGTEVVMRVGLASGEPPVDEPASVTLSETRVRVPAGDLMAPILSRVIGMYAARADFSVDRLSDAILLSDAISYQEPDEFPEAVAQVAISESDRAFTIRVGPLREGGAERVRQRMQIPEIGASLEGLADELSVSSDEEGDFLTITIAQPG